MGAYLRGLRNLFEHPMKIGIAAIAIAFASLLAEGSLINLWNLKTEKKKIYERYLEVSQKNSDLKTKILKAENSDKFIGHEAREKLDLMSEDELEFIFDN